MTRLIYVDTHEHPFTNTYIHSKGFSKSSCIEYVTVNWNNDIITAHHTDGSSRIESGWSIGDVKRFIAGGEWRKIT